MPNHTPEHIRSMAAGSAAARRSARVAGLIATAPPLSAEQIDALRRLLDAVEVLQDAQAER